MNKMPAQLFTLPAKEVIIQGLGIQELSLLVADIRIFQFHLIV